jgi:hypothetical protein
VLGVFGRSEKSPEHTNHRTGNRALCRKQNSSRGPFIPKLVLPQSSTHTRLTPFPALLRHPSGSASKMPLSSAPSRKRPAPQPCAFYKSPSRWNLPPSESMTSLCTHTPYTPPLPPLRHSTRQRLQVYPNPTSSTTCLAVGSFHPPSQCHSLGPLSTMKGVCTHSLSPSHPPPPQVFHPAALPSLPSAWRRAYRVRG